jgi:hypothetical protein
MVFALVAITLAVQVHSAFPSQPITHALHQRLPVAVAVEGLDR